MKKYKEALENITQLREVNIKRLDGFQMVRSSLFYKDVETLQELIDKETPTRPNYEGDGYYNGEIVYDTWTCPNCEKDYEVYYDKYKHCHNCGQAIDWGNYE